VPAVRVRDGSELLIFRMRARRDRRRGEFDWLEFACSSNTWPSPWRRNASP